MVGILVKLVVLSVAKKVAAYAIARTIGFPRIYRRILLANRKLFRKNEAAQARVRYYSKFMFRLPRYFYDRIRNKQIEVISKESPGLPAGGSGPAEQPETLSELARSQTGKRILQKVAASDSSTELPMTPAQKLQSPGAALGVRDPRADVVREQAVLKKNLAHQSSRRTLWTLAAADGSSGAPFLHIDFSVALRSCPATSQPCAGRQ